VARAHRSRLPSILRKFVSVQPSQIEPVLDHVGTAPARDVGSTKRDTRPASFRSHWWLVGTCMSDDGSLSRCRVNILAIPSRRLSSATFARHRRGVRCSPACAALLQSQAPQRNRRTTGGNATPDLELHVSRLESEHRGKRRKTPRARARFLEGDQYLTEKKPTPATRRSAGRAVEYITEGPRCGSGTEGRFRRPLATWELKVEPADPPPTGDYAPIVESRCTAIRYHRQGDR
jgi:hypothetical protein